MIILGLSIGELSTAALMIDGEIVAAASEERFSRMKNDERYPMHAIDYCLTQAGIRGQDLDIVAIAGLTIALGPLITRTYSTFSIQDHIRAQHQYWYPKLYKGKNKPWTQIFKDKLDLSQFPGTLGQLVSKEDNYLSEDNWLQFKGLLHEGISKHLNIPTSKIVHLEHHSCHAAYAYYGSPFRNEPTLVLTADALGDNLSATVSVTHKDTIKRIHSVNHSEFRLARLYRYITLLLGMKPNEHEFKVMGLSAYAKPETLRGPYEIFKNTMYVKGLGFAWHDNPKDMYFNFKDKLEGYRFDGIAGGLQKYLEEILSEWVVNCVKHTEINRVVLSGGISMNIKANKVLHELPEINDLFVCASGSDETLAMGACYHYMAGHCDQFDKDKFCIKPISAFLGPEFSKDEVYDWMLKLRLKDRYDVECDVSSGSIAGYLAKGFAIGRCAGRMEFSQRALGNRSIIANPSRAEIVKQINHKVKNRDFWMPFAPSVLAESATRYIVNPKNIKSPFMTIAFDSTQTAKTDLIATLHPADHTLRPQILDYGQNPEYHEIISAFNGLTGIGGLLNTSFNLHGEPIVCTPNDALHVFENSEIDAILIGNVLIKKRTPAN